MRVYSGIEGFSFRYHEAAEAPESKRALSKGGVLIF